MKTSLLLAYFCSVLYSTVAQVTVIPLTLARGQYSAVDVGEVNYFKVTPCFYGDNFNTAVLSVGLPTNTQWLSNKPYVLVELSTSSTIFDANTVFATNYVWGSPPYPFSTIIWNWSQHLDANGAFYIRVTAPLRMVAYTFEIQFVENGAITAGKYSSSAFKQNYAPSGAVFNQLMQYASIKQPHTVANYETKTYFIQFCLKDLPPSCNQADLEVVATTQATPNKPMSMFNVYGCSTPSCDYYEYLVADQLSTTVVQVEMSAALQPEILDGMYFTVAGFGGEADEQNQYYFNVKAKF